MRKILSFLLTAAMLLSISVIGIDAAGTLVFSDNFDMGFSPRNWITAQGNTYFTWDQDNTCIHGYRNARVLQSEFDAKWDRKWDQFYGKFDFQVRGYDDLEETDQVHTIKIWYRDEFTLQDNVDSGPLYYIGVEVETGRAFITKEHEYEYKDENDITRQASFNNVIAEGKINGTIEVGEDAEWFEWGIRVTSGKIEGYFNGELAVSSEYDPNAEKIGKYSPTCVDETVGSMKSPFIIFNGTQSAAMWLALDNFEVWTPDYDFQTSINYGDVNGDGKVNMLDATAMLQSLADWTVDGFVSGAADTNGDGKFNLNDVTRLLQYIADWDVTLGPVAE